MEHTPIPWEIHAWADGHNSVRICQPDHSTERGCLPVAEAEILGRDREEAEANAAFIVRAVNNHAKLLKALEALLKNHCGLVDSGDCGFWNVEEEAEVILARAVIEEAKK